MPPENFPPGRALQLPAPSTRVPAPRDLRRTSHPAVNKTKKMVKRFVNTKTSKQQRVRLTLSWISAVMPYPLGLSAMVSELQNYELNWTATVCVCLNIALPAAVAQRQDSVSKNVLFYFIFTVLISISSLLAPFLLTELSTLC